MSKAGKGDSVDTGTVGSEHPVPENIPHLASLANGGNVPKHTQHSSIPGVQAGSPVKESSFLNRETSAEGQTANTSDGTSANKENGGQASAPEEVQAAEGEGIPRR